MSLPIGPTTWLQENRLVVVSVDPVARRVRLRGVQDQCSDMSCGGDTVVVADDETTSALEALGPGDIVKIESPAAQPQRILSEQAAYLVTDILADNTDPAENAIWGSRFQLQTDEGRRPATLKTGTTNDFRDLQAFGFLAPDADATVADGALVTGVWVGNSDFSPIADVFAADGPTFIWHDYMAEVTALNALPIRDFVRPDGLEERTIDRITGQAPGEHTGPAADVEHPRVLGPGTLRGHERDPLGEVVRDDVLGQRLVVFGGDPVEVLFAHSGGIVSAPAVSSTADIASAAAG